MKARAAAGCIVLSLVGLGLCGVLVYVHLGLLRGELLGGAVCSGSGTTTSRGSTAAGMAA